MKPLDPDLESLLRDWIEKAEADLEAARGVTGTKCREQPRAILSTVKVKAALLAANVL